MFRLITLRLLETYFRHRWLWLAPVVMMLAFAGLRMVTTDATYVSMSAVYVNKESLLASLTSIREDGFSWVTPAQAAVDEFKELIQTDAFMRSVIQKTALETDMAASPQEVAQILGEARGAVWVNVLGKNTIQVGAAHEQAEVAQQLALGVIEVYIQWKINTGQEETTTALKFFEELVAQYQLEVDSAEGDLQAYLEAHPPPLHGDRPPAEEVAIDRFSQKLVDALSRLKDAQDDLQATQLNAAVNESNVRQTYLVLDAPRFPIEPTQTKMGMVIDAVIFVVVGVVLMVVGVVVGALLDRSLRFPEDVQTLLELPLLTSIPSVKPAKPTKKRPKAE
ncbi:MAG: lipopolysaccharide biosynthesis protein [Anaerolineales bacterium]|nr:lipopolysaccharide biosynthesis protein [Anaerolineales bacterium]